ncbi:M20 metallopeptidase family protein [Pseudoneobacillus rhizosphaerae]|uniref:N-acetylcysteine deacetylase n=1 Tax=Pseudoneobacillus rhizosphaerae TaxID=2880968 RepID=A0A9C7GC70_9BACI|nr:M20 family metallopeptidase [Pseudoneobacillus rhizosphaerae]CAG9609921.1 N-acetylcysteine deacetylase [Pseudoneobacillus rhizosphaerae]
MQLTNKDAFSKVEANYPKINEAIIRNLDEIIAIRRDFRKHPELAFEEKRTASIVASYLRQWGYEVQEHVGGTGVVGLLNGKQPGKVMGLRADMDALPMPDEISASYKSLNDGIAHTCGHDVHTANLLGVAKVFSEIGLEKGTLKFIFQPAEEIGQGAKAMIDDGVMENPKVDFMAGLHVNPTLNVGEFSLTNAEYTCGAVDIFELVVEGKGGHAAHPHLAVDAVMISAQVLVALQQIASRQVDPLKPVVLSVGQIQGGTKGTILPNTVTMNGTVRTLDPSVRDQVPQSMEKIATQIAEAYGGKAYLDYQKVTPSIKSDAAARVALSELVVDLFGKESFKWVNPSMGGEDFAYFSQLVPSVFFRLGTKSSDDTAYGNHHPKFNVDEEAIRFGMTVFSVLTQRYLNEEEGK